VANKVHEGTCPALLDRLVCWLLGKGALLFHGLYNTC